MSPLATSLLWVLVSIPCSAVVRAEMNVDECISAGKRGCTFFGPNAFNARVSETIADMRHSMVYHSVCGNSAQILECVLPKLSAVSAAECSHISEIQVKVRQLQVLSSLKQAICDNPNQKLGLKFSKCLKAASSNDQLVDREKSCYSNNIRGQSCSVAGYWTCLSEAAGDVCGSGVGKYLSGLASTVSQLQSFCQTGPTIGPVGLYNQYYRAPENGWF